MNSLTSRTILLAALAAALCVPAAAAAPDFLQVAIPFPFYAGDQLFPAGNYRIDIDVARNWVRVRLADGGAGAFLPGVVNRRPGAPRTRGVASFKQYGDTFFLRQVGTAARTVTHELPASRVEREMAKTRSATVVAMVHVPAR